MLIHGKMNEPCFSIPFFFGFQLVGQSIDYMEIRMLAFKVLESFEVKDIFCCPAAEKQPARAVGPSIIKRLNDILHGRHPAASADTDNLYRRVLIQVKVSIRACECHLVICA